MSIYQKCRATEAVNEEFTQLRLELDSEIAVTMDETLCKLVENFDAEVHDRLRVRLAENTDFHRHSRQVAVADYRPSFRWSDDHRPLCADPRPAGGPALYFAPDAELRFHYGNWPIRSEAVELPLRCSGYAVVDHQHLSGEVAKHHLIVAACTVDGVELSEEQTRRLFDESATMRDTAPVEVSPSLTELAESRRAATLEAISTSDGTWFDEERENLDRWADDKRASLKADLLQHDDTLKALKRDARTASRLSDKAAIQKTIKSVESVGDWAGAHTTPKPVRSNRPKKHSSMTSGPDSWSTMLSTGSSRSPSPSPDRRRTTQ